MAILKVSQMGHPSLRQECRHVTKEEILSPGMKTLLQDMWDTLEDYEGVGLAAPQVYLDISLALVGTPRNDNRYGEDNPQPTVIFNATYTGIGEASAGIYEGCLSIPGIRAFVPRYQEIELNFWNLEAKPQVKRVQGFEAIVYQHEIDHLHGILFLDRCDHLSLSFEKEFERYHQESEDEADEEK